MGYTCSFDKLTKNTFKISLKRENPAGQIEEGGEGCFSENGCFFIERKYTQT